MSENVTLLEVPFTEQYSQVAVRHYDLVSRPVANVSAEGYDDILSIARELDVSNLLVVDYNVQIHYRHNRKWHFAFKVSCDKRQFFFQESAFLFRDLSSVPRGSRQLEKIRQV